MLSIQNIHTYYDDSCALWGISLEVKDGSSVALLGRNGMGKTTTMRSVIGFSPPRTGSILYKGEEISGLPPYMIARKGIGLVPQGRGVFPSLSVMENLTMAARATTDKKDWTLERIYDLFPILETRSKLYANLLSGGEQQMLAFGRALMTNPEMILMDEPSEGLAPLIVKEIGEIILHLKENVSVLLAEQNINMALGVTDYVYVISKGMDCIVWQVVPDRAHRGSPCLQGFQ
ncbi:ABC transporter ATP-binding protein, partial [Thermodesulfobacteriota bacterium]